MSNRKKRLASTIIGFVQKYARKAQKGSDPNDRSYSREIEANLKQLSPEELSELMNAESDEFSPSKHARRKPTTDPFSKYRTGKPQHK
jgi:hypothetical protein